MEFNFSKNSEKIFKKSVLAELFFTGSGAGLPAQSETHNALGRSDLEFTTRETHWALEFKYARKGDDPEELLAAALKQAAERQYGAQSPETRLMHLGLVFSEDKRQFVAYKARKAGAQ